MARTLYSVTMSLDGFIAGPGGDMQWLTAYLGDEDPRLATLVQDDVHEALALAHEAAGDKPYVNILGAATARRVLEAGALDEVLVLVAPVLLGDGTRLFDHPGGTTVRLERLRDWSTRHANGLWYRVLPRA